MKYRIGSENVIGKVLDDEAVIINLTTGMYYGLDGPAAKIWECASAGVASQTILGELTRHYPDQAGIEAALDQLLDHMCGAGLLVADDSQADAIVAVEWPAAFQPLEMTSYDDVAEMVALDPPLPELSHEMLDQANFATRA